MADGPNAVAYPFASMVPEMVKVYLPNGKRTTVGFGTTDNRTEGESMPLSANICLQSNPD